ncbi:MAG TPA: MCP four helix bundle domain-containing protein, partial [Aquabacterium sp.]|nr:MCP four helix bundle domain-containing protein [Aquabacterium sp.]
MTSDRGPTHLHGKIMMALRDVNITRRLALGFGLVLFMMALVIGLAVTSLNNTSAEITKVCDTDWALAEAASTVNVTTRANARRTMELFFAATPDRYALIQERINQNKLIINDALMKLDSGMREPAGRLILDAVVVRRQA